MIRRCLLLLPLLVGACAVPPRRSSADRAVAAACRQEVDRVYAAQNRRELSYRDQRDTPFAASYNSGITTTGLSSAFGRDNDVQGCISQNRTGASSGDPGTSPTMDPTVR